MTEDEERMGIIGGWQEEGQQLIKAKRQEMGKLAAEITRLETADAGWTLQLALLHGEDLDDLLQSAPAVVRSVSPQTSSRTKTMFQCKGDSGCNRTFTTWAGMARHSSKEHGVVIGPRKNYFK